MAATAVDKKLAEGIATEHLRLADKCLKTSLFKWKPDHDGAAAEYLKAATVFRNAKAFDQAKESYIKVGELLKAVNSPFQAAKAYEQAGLLCKENEEFDEAVHWMELAALMFQEHGTPDTAALCFEKAAKMVEQDKPEKAIHLYTKASEVAEIESRPIQSAECIGKAARLQVKCFKFEDAIKSLCEEIRYWLEAENYEYINKVSMGVILLYLTGEDYVAADKFFRGCLNYPEFGTSEEAGTLEELLRAYDDGDEETGRAILDKPIFKSLDNVFAKLARDLKFPGGICTSEPAAAPDHENLPADEDDGEMKADATRSNIVEEDEEETKVASTRSNIMAEDEEETKVAPMRSNIVEEDEEEMKVAPTRSNIGEVEKEEAKVAPRSNIGEEKEEGAKVALTRSNIGEEHELPPELC